MPDNRDELVEALKYDNNIFNKMLGSQLENLHNRDYINVHRDYKLIAKIENKLYKKFLKLVTPDISKRLIEIDTLANGLVSKLEEKTGWSIIEDGAYKEDSSNNLDRLTFDSLITYHIPRSSGLGFHVKVNEITSEFEQSIRDMETFFYEENKELLDQINELWTEKEQIMSGNYTLKDPTPDNEKMATLISVYLDYQVPEEYDKNDNVSFGK